MARNIEFDIDEALNMITEEFWKNGFHETSMSNIVNATGVKKASLYGAFGPKEMMFQKALENYLSKNRTCDKLSGFSYIEHFFNRLTNQAISGKHTRGCLLMNSVLEFSNSKDQKWSFCYQLLEKRRERLEKELEKESLYTDAKSLSKWLIAQAFLIREFSKITSDKDYFLNIHNEIKLKLEEVRRK